MKPTTRFASIIAASLCLTAAAYADQFSYSYTFEDNLDGGTGAGAFVSGTFNGTISTSNADLITGISNVTLSLWGNPIGGTIFAEGQNGTTLGITPNGSAAVSFDGLQNNFWFVNSDLSSGDQSFTGEFFSLDGIHQLGIAAFDTTTSYHGANGFAEFVSDNPSLVQANWKVTDLTTSAVPDVGSTALLLGGALGGLAALRRRFAK